jgi:hypothetical protein
VDARQEIPVSRRGEGFDHRWMSKMLSGKTQVQQGSPATEDQFSPFRIRHSESPASVADEIKTVVVAFKKPGLGIIFRGCQDGVTDKKTELFGFAALGREIRFLISPSAKEGFHATR